MPSSHLQRKRNLFDFFPVPKILRTPAVGVDVSDESVKFIELKKFAHRIKVEQYGKYSIPAGTIKEGEIQNKEEFVAILRRLKEEKGFEFVHASLPEQDAYVFQTRLPDTVHHRQVRNVLEFKIEENVPISGDEAVFDYSLSFVSGAEKVESEAIVPSPSAEEKKDETEKSEHKEKEKQAGESTEESTEKDEEEAVEIPTGSCLATVFVYRRDLVEAYSEAFKSAGIRSMSFEIETRASAMAVVPRGDMGTYMVVDFGRSQAGLAVVSRGELAFTATLEVGGDDLDKAIIKTFSVSKDEAERMKNEKGLINSEKNRDLFTALISTAAAFKDELNRHFLYWHTHEGEGGMRDPIDKIILCGGNANLPGLPEYLAATIGVPVSRADVWVNVRAEDEPLPPIDYRHSLEYATTIGLALGPLYL